MQGALRSVLSAAEQRLLKEGPGYRIRWIEKGSGCVGAKQEESRE